MLKNDRLVVDCTMVYGKPPSTFWSGNLHRLVLFMTIRKHLSFSAIQHVAQKKLVVIPESLEETLNRQRAINRSGTIRKVVSQERRNPNRVSTIRETKAKTLNHQYPISRNRTLDKNLPGNSNRLNFIRRIQAKTSDSRHFIERRGSMRKIIYQGSRKPSQLDAAQRPDATSQNLIFRKFYPRDPYDIGKRPVQYCLGPTKDLPPIWLENLESTFVPSDPFSLLDAELRAIDQYLTPTSHERLAIERIKDATIDVISDVLPPSITPVVSGSRYTGLARADSGLDLLIPFPDPLGITVLDRKPSPTRPRVLDIYRKTLARVVDALKHNGDFGASRLDLSTNPNPIITTHHKASGLVLRIYCAPQRPAALEYVKNYLVEFPQLRPLYFAIRMILQGKGLFGMKRKSLTPYALQLMIISARKKSLRDYNRPDTLGELLLDFLHLYSAHFDYRTMGVSVEPPVFFTMSALRLIQKQGQEEGYVDPYIRGQRSLLRVKFTAAARGNEAVANHLCIQDPTNYLTDVGWSCTRTNEFQRVLFDVRRYLVTAMADKPSIKSDSNPRCFLPPIIPSFYMIEKRRSQLENRSIETAGQT